MVHLTILLFLCFIVQTVGYINLRNKVIKKTDKFDIDEVKAVTKKSANYIMLGLIIQLIIIISQITVYFLFIK